MSRYDFKALSPIEFEDLVRDLLQKEFGVRIESFRIGRDQGIDLRSARARNDRFIVQCKHFSRSGFAKLKRHLEQDERAKIETLDPSRYILATSADLSPLNKRALHKILAPYCRGPEDIFGMADLNNLLGRHPEVETSHYKLWLTSVPVLNRILNSDVFLQTDMERDAIESRLALHVQSAAFPRALEILKEHGYCIISGEPGIGKTTLSEAITVELLRNDFELIVVRGDISEALKSITPQRRQLIYYDDFLGRSSISEKLRKNEEANIIRLFHRARRDKSTKVIFTTREYVLSQARQHYERLHAPELEMGKCILNLADYSRLDRARILYNHLYFYNVPIELIEALLEKDRYKQVIDHANYSPRVIEWMTNTLGGGGFEPNEYAEAFMENLDDPSRIWRHAFENQIPPECRQLLLALATLPVPCLLEDLAVAFHACLGVDASGGAGERDLRMAGSLKVTEGSFTRTDRSGDQTVVDFHNPSIRDFVLRRIGQDTGLRSELVRSCEFFEQLERLVKLTSEGEVGVYASRGLDHGDLLHSAKRVSGKQSAEINKLRSGSSRQPYRRVAQRPGRRLRKLREWAKQLGISRIDELAVELGRKVVRNTCDEDVLYVDDLCDAASATFSAARVIGLDLSEDAERVRRVSVRELRENGTCEEWGAWYDLLGEFPGQFGSTAEFENDVEAFCESEVEAAISDSSSIDELMSWRNDFEELSEKWGIRIPGVLEQIDEAVSEFEEPESDEEGYNFRGRDGRGVGGEDGVIERMFDSLRTGEK